MKQLLLILSVALLGIGCSPERYSEDEVITPGESPNDTVTFLKSDMTPLNGIVYGEFGDIGEYSNGLKDGTHKDWHENGQLWVEENYIDGERDGLYRRWYENGQLGSEQNYKDGEQVSEKRWDEEGNLTKDETHFD
jgi:antitoxin component YwqK of YwqJK toxin-antitoxin module